MRLAEQFDIRLPTATDSRHAAATAVTKTGQQTSQTAVAAMMSHSVRTQERYYSATKGLGEAIQGFCIMEGLRQKNSPKTVARRAFTEEDITSISNCFQDHIETSTVPHERECRDFLREHPLSREAKQIRDKVRHLIKQNDN